VLVNLMSDDATYDRDGHPNQITLQLGPHVRHGDALTDPCFPRVWPR